MKDRFSEHASQYATFRPTYPASLYDFIYSHVKHFNHAWDCGCGNGQATQRLAEVFKRVSGSDISAEQLGNAYRAQNIDYMVSPAEQTPYKEGSFDLITVAQALHWFDLPRFYKEVRRTAVREGVIAVWGYGLLRAGEDVDSAIDVFYRDVIGSYWDPERRHIDTHFRELNFPFDEVKAPSFDMTFEWSLKDLLGYLDTWSAVKKFSKANGYSPVNDLAKEIGTTWGSTRQVKFPLFLRLGRVG